MASLLRDRVYPVLPTGLQSAALAFFGLRNRRRLRAWRAALETCSASQYWSVERQIEWVGDRLRSILLHAIDNVPRYEEFSRIRRDVESAPPRGVFDLLGAFPVLTRADVLANPERFTSNAFSRTSLVATRTSGTTGTPFTTWMEPSALLMSDALWFRRTMWAGFEDDDWIARLVGDPIVPLSESNPRKPFRRSFTDRRLYLSTFHLSPETATRMAEVLLREKPQFLMGYPSALATFVQLTSGVHDFSMWHPKAVLYSSEPLHEHQRVAIQTAIKAPIRGLYGCAERVVSAAECDAGAFHLSLVDGYVEGQFGLTPANEPAVITGLLGLAMPLIRFQLGDNISLLHGSEPCACGRTLPQMSPVVTKHEDVVRTPSGRRISPSILTWALKDLRGIGKTQILQTRIDSITVRVELAGAPAEELERLRSRIDEMCFGELEVRVEKTDKLELTSAGKSRFVVSTIA